MSRLDAPGAASFDEALTATVARGRRDTMGDLLRRSAARYPGKTAVVCGELSVTYAELDETVDRMAAALAERGLRKGDRLGLLSRNSYGFIVAYYASARVGSICVPVNYMLRAAEVAYILGHAGANAMIAEDAAGRGRGGRDRPGGPRGADRDPRRDRVAGSWRLGVDGRADGAP